MPPKIIDAQLGKAAVYEEAINSDLGEFYYNAVKESGIKPVNRPEIEVLQFEDDKPLKFKATVEVEPKVELGDYKNIKAKKDIKKVTKEDISSQLDILRDRFANLEVAEGRVAQAKDYVLINFDGTVDGVAFEGGSAKDYLLELGSKTMIEGFEDQIIGAKAGEIRDVNVVFPKNYTKEDLSGKAANFKVLVKEIKVKKLPELNDDFAKQLGEFENLKELEEEITKQLEAKYEITAENNFRSAVLKEVADGSKVNIPKIMIDNMAKRLLNEFEYNMSQRGVSVENYKLAANLSDEEMLKNFNDQAETTVKENLVLTAIAEKEKIEPSQEVLDEEVKKIAKDKDLETAKKELEEKGILDYLKENLRYSETLEWLTSGKYKVESGK